MGIECLNCKRNFEPGDPAQFWCSLECVEEWKEKQNTVFSEEQKEEIREIIRDELNKRSF